MGSNFHRILLGLVILLPVLSFTSFFSGVQGIEPPSVFRTDIWSIETTPTYPPTPTPYPTQVVIFPLVKQDRNSSLSIQGQQTLQVTPELPEITTPTPTLTPTFIPPQDVSTNMPIVFGAIAIVIVIVGAWFFISRREY